LTLGFKIAVRKSTLSVLFSVVFLDNLGFAIVVPYLFFYVQALGGSTFIYGLLLASYSIMSFIFTPIVARFSDRYGRRKIMLAALAIASFSYFLFGSAQAVWLLFVGRMLSGTTAATVPIAQAYVADVTTKEKRLRYLGLLGAAAGIAFILGPGIGGTLSALYGYSVPSYLAAALAFSNLILAYFLLPEPAAFNLKRTVLSFQNLLSSIKKKAMILLLSIYFLFFVTFVFLQSALSPWLQTVFGFGSLQTGLIFFFIGSVSVITQAFLLPQLNKKISTANLVLLGIVCFLISMAILSFVSNIGVMLLVISFSAFGFGIQIVTYNALISLNTSESAQGSTLGVAWAIAGAAQSTAPVLATAIFGIGLSFGFVGLVFLASVLIGLSTVPLVLIFKNSERSVS
jgi:DHA1 family tetracycline resistance protein-like MFS transporter